MGHLLFSFRSVVVVATRRAAALSNALRYTQQYDAVRYDCQAVNLF
jgi:hypothetical protein